MHSSLITILGVVSAVNAAYNGTAIVSYAASPSPSYASSPIPSYAASSSSSYAASSSSSYAASSSSSYAASSRSSYVTPSSSSYAASSTPSCPAPGTTSNGQYSCNPAHQYPSGQTCVLVNGCYYLTSPPKSTTPSYSTSSAPHPTASCPAAGTTNSNGQYSCNPAHAYPAPQTCVLVNGCYYLTTPKPTSYSTTSVPKPTGGVSTTTSTAPKPTTPVYTGAASKIQAFGGLATFFGFVILAL